MDFQKNDICELAKLTNIAITEEERADFIKYFDDLLRFLHPIADIDVSVTEAEDTVSFLREDEVAVHTSRDQLLSNAKTIEDGCITVPLVMEDL